MEGTTITLFALPETTTKPREVEEPKKSKKKANPLPRMTRGKDLKPNPHEHAQRGATLEESLDWAAYDKRVLYTMAKLGHTQAQRRKRAAE